MAVHLSCPGCGTHLAMVENIGGKKVRCPKCSEVFVADSAEAGEAPLLAGPAAPAEVRDRVQDRPRPAPPPTRQPLPQRHRPARYSQETGAAPVVLIVVASVLGGLLLLGIIGALIFVTWTEPVVADKPMAGRAPLAPFNPGPPPVAFDNPQGMMQPPWFLDDPGFPGAGDLPPGILDRLGPRGFDPGIGGGAPGMELARPAPVLKPADVKVPAPVRDKASWDGVVQKIRDLSVMEVTLNAKDLLPCVCWAKDGKSFYTLDTNGVLRQISLDGFVEQQRLDIGRRCGWLSVSAVGLVVTLSDLNEVWLVDSVGFQVTRRVAVASAGRAVSAPSLKVAFVAGGRGEFGGGSVTSVDLVKGSALRQFFVESQYATVSPDGKYYFAQGGIEQLKRWRIQDSELVFEDATERIAQNGQSISVSPDSKYVCLPSGGGNYGTGYATYVYPVANLQRREFTINSGAYPRTVGFDPKAGLVYAQGDKTFMVFTTTGIKQKEVDLTSRGDEPRQFLAHPDGHKLFVLTGSKMYWVQLNRDEKVK
jgi:predicted Zn finger-like uncharacterized protein